MEGIKLTNMLFRPQIIEYKNLDIITGKTAEATDSFNRLCAEGKDVAGAFHLTC
jgi:hypothetical protein